MAFSDEESTTDEDETRLEKPRVTKKKTYFNLMKHIESNQNIPSNRETKFPLINKSIRFTRIIDSKHSDSELDSSDITSSVKNENNQRSPIPWHLLYAEPTRVEDIENDLILDKILKSQEQMKQKIEIREVKFKQSEYFIQMLRNFRKKFSRIKKMSKPKKKIRIVEGLLPEEEFARLKQNYLEKSLIVEETSIAH